MRRCKSACEESLKEIAVPEAAAIRRQGFVNPTQLPRSVLAANRRLRQSPGSFNRRIHRLVSSGHPWIEAASKGPAQGRIIRASPQPGDGQSDARKRLARAQSERSQATAPAPLARANPDRSSLTGRCQSASLYGGGRDGPPVYTIPPTCVHVTVRAPHVAAVRARPRARFRSRDREIPHPACTGERLRILTFAQARAVHVSPAGRAAAVLSCTETRGAAAVSSGSAA